MEVNLKRQIYVIENIVIDHNDIVRQGKQNAYNCMLLFATVKTHTKKKTNNYIYTPVHYIILRMKGKRPANQ